MSWRDRLLQASFRGVAFKVDSADLDTGRRLIRHEFVRRDDFYHEDVGRKPRIVRMDAYLVGDDYDIAARDLVEACERGGPGTLSHPHLGQFQVVCDTCRRRETREEGRFAKFELVFEPYRDAEFPRSRKDTLRRAQSAADAMAEAAEADFIARYQYLGVPEFVRSAARSALSAARNAMAQLNVFAGATREVAAFSRNVQGLVSQVGALITAPADLALSVRQAVSSISAAAGNALDSFSAYRVLLGLTSGDLPGGSAMTAAANLNGKLVTDLVKYAALSGAVVAGVQAPWESLQQAVAQREALSDAIDELSETAGDPVYQALQGLRSILVEGMPREEQQPPELRELVLAASLPSLAVSYQLYDDVTRAEEIVARNDIANPAFLPGQEPLEVLSA